MSIKRTKCDWCGMEIWYDPEYGLQNDEEAIRDHKFYRNINDPWYRFFCHDKHKRFLEENSQYEI